MNRTDRIVYGAISGAIGGFVASFILWLVFSSSQIIDSIKYSRFRIDYLLEYFGMAFLAGLAGMFLLGIAGAIKGSRENYNFTQSSWTKTGFFTTVIVSMPMWPILLFGLIYTLDSEYEDNRPGLLAILPTLFVAGALGGFIAGKVFQIIENQRNLENE